MAGLNPWVVGIFLFIRMLPMMLDYIPTITVSLSGTYDALVLPIQLPRAEVINLFPFPSTSEKDELGNPLGPMPWLLDPPQKFYDDLGIQKIAGSHPVFIQLGHQTRTGPAWLPAPLRSTFSEAKIDIPFARHGKVYRDPSLKKELKDRPLVYKQAVYVSSRILALATKLVPGTRGVFSAFSPSSSPSIYGPSEPSIQYDLPGYLTAKFTKLSTIEGDAWSQIESHLSTPWFADRTGHTAVRFTFGVSEIAKKFGEARGVRAAEEVEKVGGAIEPTPYEFEMEINEVFLTRNRMPETAYPAGADIPSETFRGTAFRVRQPFEGRHIDATVL